MALPVVVPVAKALAPPAAAKAGAVLRGLIRNGPTLLRMVDQFRAPPSLGPQVADTPRRDRLRDLVADAIAGAQLGVASLPNPQLPGGNGAQWLLDALTGNLPLRALGAGLSQLWGLLNSREDLMPGPESGLQFEQLAEFGVQVEGNFNPNGETTVTVTGAMITGVPSGNFPSNCDEVEAFVWPATPTTGTKTGLVGIRATGTPSGTGNKCGGFDALGVSGVFADGSVAPLASINRGQAFGGTARNLISWPVTVSLSGVGEGSIPVAPDVREPVKAAPDVDPWFSGLPSAVVPMPAAVPAVAAAIAQAEAAGVNPLPPAGAVTVPSNPPADWFAGLGGSGVPAVPGSTPGTLPGQVPTVQPLPAFVPRPVPGPSPAETQPETQPQVAPTTRPTTTPTTPATTPGAVPVPGPAGRPLTDAGTVPAPVQLPIPTTDPNFHFPVPGAPPVTGVQVRPDLKNIAKEVGRLEQKAARMLENQSDAEGKPFDLSELLRLLRLIWELLSGGRDGGEYAAIGVCEVDINGNPLEDQPVIPVPFAGAGNPMDAVSAKVDAIAQLLQEHKQLRQPICRPPKTQGEPVTVFFEDLGNG